MNSSKQILIVDDEPHILLSLECQLADIGGLDVITAENGEEAFQKIQEFRPRLVFLDVMMPKMSGYDVCAKVKADPELKDTYIILLTAKGQERDKTRGLDVGADEYITKPFDPDAILDKANDILGAA